MEKNWTLIYTTGNLIHIDILRNLLLEKEIKSVFINKKDSSYLFGDIELYVDQKDVTVALQVVAQFETNETAR
ncbi:MAG: hypothetical protein CSA95_07150 [Bacteroidetes bacterium]|nr:MAG: hypothetical protein CSA95_07150 [Bacteroidota bacterium]PIE88047.1 MAG: hypothetical protein CSA04_03885 [Bacteroidota bacterium]